MGTGVTGGIGKSGAAATATGGVRTVSTVGGSAPQLGGGAGIGGTSTNASAGAGPATGGAAAGPAQGGSATSGACPVRANDSRGNLQIVASVANNYSFSSKLSLKVDRVKPNARLSYDWSGVTKDFTGHTLDPKADIGLVETIIWNLTQAQFEQQLNADSLGQRSIAAGASIFTEGTMTSGDFSDFEILTGGPVNQADLMVYFDPSYFDPASHFNTILLATGRNPGKGTRMMRGFVLDPNSDKTVITIDSDSTNLTFNANLHILQPTPMPAGKVPAAIDWTDMDGKPSARDGTFDIGAITRVRIASFDKHLSELESEFLDLEQLATGIWEAAVDSGTSTLLSTLRSTSSKDPVTGLANGQTFTGIDAQQTWLLSLECGPCSSKAPPYLTVLVPCQ